MNNKPKYKNLQIRRDLHQYLFLQGYRKNPKNEYAIKWNTEYAIVCQCSNS